MSIVRQREDAEDVVQVSFMNALEHIDDFRGDSSFATWISRIVTNNALKQLRRRRGAEMVPVDGNGDDAAGAIPRPEFVADWRNDPLVTLERGELRKLLADGIEHLTEGQRLVFVLRDLQGMSIAETAEALGLSEANVKVRLLRARLALREGLTRAFGDATNRLTPAQRHAREAA